MTRQNGPVPTVSKVATVRANLACPFTIKIDTREQRPYSFLHLRADARQHGRPLDVAFVRGTLPTGDYSIEAMESVVAIERKSKEDLFGTLGGGRARFTRELERLNELPHAFVIVESDWLGCLHYPPAFSALKPKVVYRSVVAWQVRYPRVHWWFCASRALGETTTFRVLERVWIERMRSKGVEDPNQ